MAAKLRFEVRLLRGPGAGEGRIWEPGARQRILIGRSSTADLRLDHPTVSERHALLEERDGVWWLQDLGSSNGTLLNERVLTAGQEVLCKPGDVLCIGPFLVGVLDTGLEEVTEDGASTQSLALGLVARLLDTGQVGHLPRLRAVAGMQSSLTVPLPLGRPVVLGRDPGCHVVVPGEDVSRRHAKVYVDRDGCWLADLDSKNGTFVDGRRLRGLWQLHSGQQVQIGDAVFSFEDPAEEVLAELEGAAQEIVAYERNLVSEPLPQPDPPPLEPGVPEGDPPEPAPELPRDDGEAGAEGGPTGGQEPLAEPGPEDWEDEDSASRFWILWLVLGVAAVAGAAAALYVVVAGP